MTPRNRLRMFFGDDPGWKHAGSLLGDGLRRRLLTQTGDYLTMCLRHREMGVSIPAIPADNARFPRKLAEHFWDVILFDGRS